MATFKATEKKKMKKIEKNWGGGGLGRGENHGNHHFLLLPQLRFLGFCLMKEK